MEEFVVKPLFEDTIDKQVALFNEVFKKNISVESWRYKNYSNPLMVGRNIATVIGVFYGEELAGMCGFIAGDYVYKNQVIRCVNAGDAAVKEAFQRRGLYKKIMQFAESYYVENGYDMFLGYTYPSFGSYICLIKMGWLDNCEESTAFIPFDIKKIIKDKTKLTLPTSGKLLKKFAISKARKICKKNPNCTITQYENPDDISPKANGFCDFISAKYDAEYLKWKLKKTIYIKVGSNDETESVFAVQSGKDAYIAAVFSNASEKELSVHFAKLIEFLSDKYCSLKVWSTVFQPEICRALKRCGMVIKERKHSYHYICKPLSDKCRDFAENKANWYPQYIDIDNIIKME